MRMKVRRFAIAAVVICLGIFTLERYKLFYIQQSKSHWRVLLGPRITITFNRFSASLRNSSSPRNHSYAAERPIKILLWSDAYKNLTFDTAESVIFPSYGKPKLPCPIEYLFVTDRSELYSSHGVVIHIKEADDLPLELAVNASMVLQYDEPSIRHEKLKNEEFMRRFHYSIAYSLDSDFPSPKIREPDINLPLDFHQKHDLAAAIFSNCTKLRTRYATALSKFMRIKSFGDCLRNVEKNNVARIYERNYVASKLRLIRMYKFTLVFMKYDCNDYIDEQLNHAWHAGTLPVFMGTNSLEDILPRYLKDSFISVRHFRQPIDLADHLERLAINRDLYQRYMDWRGKSVRPDESSALWKIWHPDYSPGCQVAMRLINDRREKRPKKFLKGLNCKERSIESWIN